MRLSSVSRAVAVLLMALAASPAFSQSNELPYFRLGLGHGIATAVADDGSEGSAPSMAPNDYQSPWFEEAYDADPPAVSGLDAPLTWTLETGTLPPGLSLNSSTGVIGGIATAPGTWSGISLRATDPDGDYVVGAPFSMTVPVLTGGSGSIVATSNHVATVGTAFASSAPSASGFSNPVTWTVASGSLPPGLSLDASTGVVSGTPTAAGIRTYRLGAIDSVTGYGATSSSISIGVASPATGTAGLLTMTGGGNRNYTGESQRAISTTAPVMSNSIGTVSWSVVAGSLPPGLTLNSSTGVISGRTYSTGTWSGIRLRGTDAGSGWYLETGSIQIKVDPLQYGLVLGMPVKAFQVTRGVALPASGTNAIPGFFSVSVISATSTSGSIQYSVLGTLPPGVTFNTATRQLNGTPTQTGTYTLTMRVFLASLPYNQTDTENFTVTVVAP